MGKLRLSARHVFIILWVSWAMFCVRFGFRIGLIGPDSGANGLSTALFAVIFCALIPLSLLLFRKSNMKRLVSIGVPCAAAGIVAFLISPVLIPLAAALLAAGSAFFTAAFLYLYAFDLTKYEQVALIVIFLFAKPLLSLSAVFLSDHTGKVLYILVATAFLAGIAVTTRFLSSKKFSFGRTRPSALKFSPNWSLLGIYVLFSLIIFERMNGAFALFANGISSPHSYYYYFAGVISAALVSWWMFIRKNFPVSFAFDIFLFAALIHFVFNIASVTGLGLPEGPSMLFFGVSDIVYVFLFLTAASISAAYGRRVFMGFALVFGAALLGGFSLSYFLYASFQVSFQTVYALASLAMLAFSFLLAPLLRSATRRITPGQDDFPAKAEQKNSSVRKSGLTPRETELVDYYLKGYSNQQIAQILHIAPSTVKVHSRNIYEKLNIKSRIELIFLFQNKPEEE